jgi:hypothetical protein
MSRSFANWVISMMVPRSMDEKIRHPSWRVGSWYVLRSNVSGCIARIFLAVELFGC